MDWDYILSVSPEDLQEEEKDDLYNTVTWFNCDSEKLDQQKSLCLLKISQEVLKYKGEQVEILLHKLDELATQQGEEEVRKLESDTDARSSKSRKSSSIEFENLEQKYLELKNKHKKQLKINEKNLSELKKLQQKMSGLEEEKQRLVREMQMMNQDDNQSDVSETVKEQHTELAVTLHNKNKQISDLLRDIEETENENIVLREKLANVRDELAVATNEISALTEHWKARKIELEESTETIKQLTAENENLQDELRDVQEQKLKFEQEMEEFTAEVNVKVNEWKKILDEKEKEIDDLKSQKMPSSHHSSLSSLPQDKDSSHMSVINRLLVERESQLMEVKTRLQQGIKEMEETSVVIKDLTKDKQENERRSKQLSGSLKELKKQLNSAHERCRDLQEELNYVEKLVQKKDGDVQEILEKLKEDGGSDLAENLEQIQNLKGQTRVQEKQIMSLVKASNKLQDSCDRFEKENEALKYKLGLSSDATVDTSGISTKQKQKTKEIQVLKKHISSVEEHALQLKLENRRLHKLVNMLSNQITEFGEIPEADVSNYKPPEEEKSDISIKKQIKALVEENEALRKGLHEIMDSVNTKRESTLTEIKSETLEKLLRALDVKHISGWYHPAMRLQAELHNQEGVSAELREQLRITKLESRSLDSARESEKSKEHAVEDTVDFSTVSEIFDVKDTVAVANIKKTLEHLLARIDAESLTQQEIEPEILRYNQNFEEIGQQISLLYHEYANEKENFINRMSGYEEKIGDLEESNTIKEEKIKILTKECQIEESLVSKSLELAENNVILLRKCSFFENESLKLSSQVGSLQTDLMEAQSACLKKISDLSKKNKVLSNTVSVLTNEIALKVDLDSHRLLQNDFDNLTIKYRDLLQNYEKVKEYKEFELKMSQEIRANLQREKEELKSKHLSAFSGDNLSKKLTDSEMKEINERQRANHTNNLFELVKEQLQKSEERFGQVEKYSKDVLQKNVVLQEHLKDCENKLLDYVDLETFKEMQERYNNLLKANEKLHLDCISSREEAQNFKNKVSFENMWNSQKQEEFLNLKHLIVDLQSVSDEKMHITSLSNDLSRLKLQEVEFGNKIADLSDRLKDSLQKNDELALELEVKIAENSSKENHYRNKIGVLRDLLAKSKLQYLGCVPLPSEEKFIDNIKLVIADKHEAFMNLYHSEIISNESSVLKEQYERELANLEQALKVCVSDSEQFNEIMTDQQEKKVLHFNEIKFRRQAELKETQLQHIFDRVKIQDEQIIKLEEQLFALHKNYSLDYDTDVSLPVVQEKPVKNEPIKIVKSKECQTEETDGGEGDSFGSLRAELINVGNEVAAKEQIIQQLRSKITEHEMNISLFRKQLGDKQSQISFYERHILELQNKSKDADFSSSSESDRGTDDDESLALKSTIKTHQEVLRQKEEEILKYQSLLKEDRDKHSMAASLMREELKMLQKCLSEEKQKCAELQSSVEDSRPSKAALEQYFLQVHSLESELSDLHTRVSSLQAQLQATRQEAVRWRSLANDRLEAMQKLGNDLEELHRDEILVYKNESEKWRDEVNNLKLLISKYRSEMGHEFDIQKIMKDKDNRIHELTVMLRSAKSEVRQAKNYDKSDSESLTKLSELEFTREQLVKEHDTLKRRFEQLLSRERSAREEIRELKSKLMRKPTLSARSDRSERSIKDLLQKKNSSLENEIVELKDELNRQISMNESHRMKASEDFDKWNKMKHWQQTAEKFKTKLKAKESDFEKLQQTCAGYRILIERLEREKFTLENRIRSLKGGVSHQFNFEELEMLRVENMKLISENEGLIAKLGMQQHHAGGLGAAMLQEKLEAQERKIAVLELSAKGTVEVRAELERLQNSLAGLQKINLRLEAENLDFKLDLEKSAKEAPYLKEQIQHLENYIEVLKKENFESAQPSVEGNPRTDSKKVSELERTIFVLKRVVEKLQAENKRLLTGKRPYSGSSDKLKRDYQRLKEQYGESIQLVSKLEDELKTAKANQNKPVRDDVIALSDELTQVKEQLEMKSQLLNKVKVLLQRAAAKEKALLDEVNMLKLQVADNDGVAERE